MVVTAVFVILLLVLAGAVIAGVVYVYSPDGGLKGWVQESYEAWKSNDLDKDSYHVTVRNSNIESIFTTFEDASEQELYLAQNAANLPGAKMVRETSDEVYDYAVRSAHLVADRTKDIREKATERAKKSELGKASQRAKSTQEAKAHPHPMAAVYAERSRRAKQAQ